MNRLSKFKNASGVWITKGLFWEMSPAEDKTKAVFTLKDEPFAGLPSLKQLYFSSIDDVTEFTFANTHLGGWEHWQALLSMKWFVEGYVDVWRTEKEIYLKSHALRQVMAETRSEKNALAASKFLLEYLDKSKSGRGRPTKAEVNRAALDEARKYDDFNQDFLRITSTADKPN